MFKKLIGKKITKVYINDGSLRFDTASGPVDYHVVGDCCSMSYFHDFLGVKNLIENGPVKAVEEIYELAVDEVRERFEDSQNIMYGYRIVTESDTYGDVSSVFSFRNASNGYYGGEICEGKGGNEPLIEITTDWINN